jgi:selenocysteine lyase/cysteine desulfurase
MADQEMRQFRQLFPICTHTTYLASCSCGALAEPVRHAVETFLRDWKVLGPHWEEAWYGAVIEAERLFAQMYHVTERQVVLLPSVTSALAAVASALHPEARATFGGRTRVLLPAGEFPTTSHHWSKQPGLEVIGIPADVEDLSPFLDEQTLLVCCSHVCYRTGRRRTLKPLLEQAHQAGALVLVDDSQASGIRPLDAEALGVDFLVASGHKYLLGLPGGGAFLLVRTDLLKQLHPTTSGWAAHQDFVRAVHERDGRICIEPGDQGWDPFRFEETEDAWRFAGGTANILGAFAARAGLRLLLETGIEAIERHIAGLVARLLAGCQEQGIALKTPPEQGRCGPMVVVRTPEPAHLTTLLAERRIRVGPRGPDGVCIAVHGYNTEDDIRQVLAALKHWC